MKAIVTIPNVSRDERIGSVFNHLFHVIMQTEQSLEDEILWDFQTCSFYHPFFLAPLAIYKFRSSKKIECSKMPSHMRNYFNLVKFDTLLPIAGAIDIPNTLESYADKSFTPITKFALEGTNVDLLQSVFQSVVLKQSKADEGIKIPLSYFLSELVCNISQHSESKYGYLFSQYLAREQCIDICIADEGITVFGSYVKTKKYLDEIGCNEAEALKMANEGYSTKDRPGAENRGYGISTSKSMLVDGLKGSFFMLSGNAFHRYDLQGKSYVKLPETIRWDGTIILMRLPVNVPEGFNYFDYLY